MGAVLLLGLGCFVFRSRIEVPGDLISASLVLWGPPGGRVSFPLMVRLFAAFLRIAPLWETSGISTEEGPSYRGEEPINFSLLSKWEGTGTTIVPVDSS